MRTVIDDPWQALLIMLAGDHVKMRQAKLRLNELKRDEPPQIAEKATDLPESRRKQKFPRSPRFLKKGR